MRRDSDGDIGGEGRVVFCTGQRAVTVTVTATPTRQRVAPTLSPGQRSRHPSALTHPKPGW